MFLIILLCEDTVPIAGISLGEGSQQQIQVLLGQAAALDQGRREAGPLVGSDFSIGQDGYPPVLGLPGACEPVRQVQVLRRGPGRLDKLGLLQSSRIGFRLGLAAAAEQQHNGETKHHPFHWVSSFSGSRSRTSVPIPRVLSISSVPPWASAMALTRDSPRPKPPRCLLREGSAV